jgi:hypothetical protein
MTLQTLYIALVLAVAPFCAAAAQPNVWKTYVVAETGAEVEIPISIFSGDAGKPEGGRGQRFLTSDRRANLTIQSISNEANDAPADFLAKQKPPSDIIYKKVTSRFFVVSSVLNGRIWYNRCNRVAGYMNCVLINYPAGEKRQWDNVVTRISRSLK